MEKEKYEEFVGYIKSGNATEVEKELQGGDKASFSSKYDNNMIGLHHGFDASDQIIEVFISQMQNLNFSVDELKELLNTKVDAGYTPLTQLIDEDSENSIEALESVIRIAHQSGYTELLQAILEADGYTLAVEEQIKGYMQELDIQNDNTLGQDAIGNVEAGIFQLESAINTGNAQFANDLNLMDLEREFDGGETVAHKVFASKNSEIIKAYFEKLQGYVDSSEIWYDEIEKHFSAKDGKNVTPIGVLSKAGADIVKAVFQHASTEMIDKVLLNTKVEYKDSDGKIVQGTLLEIGDESIEQAIGDWLSYKHSNWEETPWSDFVPNIPSTSLNFLWERPSQTWESLQKKTVGYKLPEDLGDRSVVVQKQDILDHYDEKSIKVGDPVNFQGGRILTDARGDLRFGEISGASYNQNGTLITVSDRGAYITNLLGSPTAIGDIVVDKMENQGIQQEGYKLFSDVPNQNLETSADSGEIHSYKEYAQFLLPLHMAAGNFTQVGGVGDNSKGNVDFQQNQLIPPQYSREYTYNKLSSQDTSVVPVISLIGTQNSKKDFEALAIHEGNYYVSDEFTHQILKYTNGDFGQASEIMNVPWKTTDFAYNKGIEAFDIDANGNFFAIEEYPFDKGGNQRAYFWNYNNEDGNINQQLQFNYQSIKGFGVSDMAFAPDGSLFVLERKYEKKALGMAEDYLVAVKYVLHEVLQQAINAEGKAILKGNTIIKLDNEGSYTRYGIADNFESIAVEETNGTYSLSLITDDNRAAFQRTIMLQFKANVQELGGLKDRLDDKFVEANWYQANKDWTIMGGTAISIILGAGGLWYSKKIKAKLAQEGELGMEELHDKGVEVSSTINRLKSQLISSLKGTIPQDNGSLFDLVKQNQDLQQWVNEQADQLQGNDFSQALITLQELIQGLVGRQGILLVDIEQQHQAKWEFLATVVQAVEHHPNYHWDSIIQLNSVNGQNMLFQADRNEQWIKLFKVEENVCTIIRFSKDAVVQEGSVFIENLNIVEIDATQQIDAQAYKAKMMQPIITSTVQILKQKKQEIEEIKLKMMQLKNPTNEQLKAVYVGMKTWEREVAEQIASQKQQITEQVNEARNQAETPINQAIQNTLRALSWEQVRGQAFVIDNLYTQISQALEGLCQQNIEDITSEFVTKFRHKLQEEKESVEHQNYDWKPIFFNQEEINRQISQIKIGISTARNEAIQMPVVQLKGLQSYQDFVQNTIQEIRDEAFSAIEAIEAQKQQILGQIGGLEIEGQQNVQEYIVQRVNQIIQEAELQQQFIRLRDAMQKLAQIESGGQEPKRANLEILWSVVQYLTQQAVEKGAVIKLAFTNAENQQQSISLKTENRRMAVVYEEEEGAVDIDLAQGMDAQEYMVRQLQPAIEQRVEQLHAEHQNNVQEEMQEERVDHEIENVVGINLAQEMNLQEVIQKEPVVVEERKEGEVENREEAVHVQLVQEQERLGDEYIGMAEQIESAEVEDVVQEVVLQQQGPQNNPPPLVGPNLAFMTGQQIERTRRAVEEQINQQKSQWESVKILLEDEQAQGLQEQLQEFNSQFMGQVQGKLVELKDSAGQEQHKQQFNEWFEEQRFSEQLSQQLQAQFFIPQAQQIIGNAELEQHLGQLQDAVQKLAQHVHGQEEVQINQEVLGLLHDTAIQFSGQEIAEGTTVKLTFTDMNQEEQSIFLKKQNEQVQVAEGGPEVLEIKIDQIQVTYTAQHTDGMAQHITNKVSDYFVAKTEILRIGQGAIDAYRDDGNQLATEYNKFVQEFKGKYPDAPFAKGLKLADPGTFSNGMPELPSLQLFGRSDENGGGRSIEDANSVLVDIHQEYGNIAPAVTLDANSADLIIDTLPSNMQKGGVVYLGIQSPQFGGCVPLIFKIMQNLAPAFSGQRLFVQAVELDNGVWHAPMGITGFENQQQQSLAGKFISGQHSPLNENGAFLSASVVQEAMDGNVGMYYPPAEVANEWAVVPVGQGGQNYQPAYAQTLQNLFGSCVEWLQNSPAVKKFIYRSEIEELKTLAPDGINVDEFISTNQVHKIFTESARKLHPDKQGGDASDFIKINSITDTLQQPVTFQAISEKYDLAGKIQWLSNIAYKGIVALKTVDSVVDTYKLCNEPTTENALAVVLDAGHLYSSMGMPNAGWVSGGMSVLPISYAVYQGEYWNAGVMTVVTAIYLALPYVLGAIPVVGQGIAVVYTVGMLGYAGYHTVNKVHSVITDALQFSEEKKIHITPYAKPYGQIMSIEDEVITFVDIEEEMSGKAESFQLPEEEILEANSEENLLANENYTLVLNTLIPNIPSYGQTMSIESEITTSTECYINGLFYTHVDFGVSL